MPGGKCSFQDAWMEHDDAHPFRKVWVRRGKDKNSAFCSFCKKNIDVSHSGVNALTSHEKGKKHQQSENNFTSGKQLTLHSFNKSIETRPTCTDKDDLSMPSSSSVCENLSPKTDAPCTSVESNRSISNFLLNESVTKAEILWCAYCVTSHTSTRMGGTAVNIFPCMFPDSCIASKLKLQKDKIGYSVTYGLGPYFNNLVTSSVKRSPVFALSIDESLNDICQKQQLDVVANFWDDESDIISTKYVTSLFLEKSTALDVLDSFLGFVNTENLSLDNLVQLSTDGPNVNLKLLFDLHSHMKSTLSSKKQILDVGTCSLHIINGAYKTAHKSVTWNLNQFLRAIYRLFKNFPSRRGIYKQITGSSVFPKKFCAIRWIENSSVIERSIAMLSHLKKYVSEIEKPPETQNFEIVKQILNTDCTLAAKLNFSSMIALELEDFLTRFQRNAPLLPFLHQEVFSLMRSIASKFIKNSVMDKMTTGAKLCSLDLNCDSNFKSLDNIDIGFGAMSSLKNVKEVDVQKFKLDCKKFLVALFKKLVLKSPLQKRVVLGATCLNPKIMKNAVLRESRINVAIQELIKHNQLTPANGDIIKRAYLSFCQDGEVKEVIDKFNWEKDRLDTMYSKLFKTISAEDVNKEFVNFTKKLLVCFHSNAAVERSFSFNKEFLVENLEEKSLVAQRLLHDHIISLEGMYNLAIYFLHL